MDEYIEQIISIIFDYRNESGFNIDKNHVYRWISQFNQTDKEFLLSELLHILPNSYLSKQDVIETFEKIFEYLKDKYEFSSVDQLLDHVLFLNCQSELKSQSVLLSFLNDISIENFDKPLNECGKNKIKFWIYIDDVLGSGGTFRHDIEQKIDEYGKEKFMKEEIKIISIFFFLHTWGQANSKYILLQKYGSDLVRNIEFHYAIYIENDPRINSYNPNPKFNLAYPIKDGSRPHVDIYLDSLKADRHDSFAYRNPQFPLKEEFFSSPENRIRYENIILDMGLEIINRIKNISAPIRPLGLVPPSYKTLGTGSHAFTWRNISNTCPLVYWWEFNDWFPLFPVQNRGS